MIVVADRPLDPAAPASGQSAAAPVDNRLIRGRKRIAHALRKSEKTISRWVARGILPKVDLGPRFSNSVLTVREADVEKLKDYSDESASA